ncbi:angio-associated migratory cell protein [Galendromus occidentalis]|uniref:Angio-associated migratory cell protein n=1 Tax=Galendromus occidentalis TaxID=34638 RepID=A0AAJ6QS76_9ACAR|nr:angio-associated migratory cell protein [Galendromus occidentalis]
MSCSRDPDSDIEDDIHIIASDDEDLELVEELDGGEAFHSGSDDESESQDADTMDLDNRVVFQPSRDDSIRTLEGHTDAIFAVEVSASGQLLVSGGKDDRARLWDSTGQEVLEFAPFKDSVIHVGFSKDEKFVMAADMAGKVQVYDVQSRGSVFEAEVDDITWTAWHPSAAALVAGTQDGSIWLWLIPHGHTKTLPSSGETTTSGTFLSDGKRIVAGYADGCLRLWDLKTCQALSTISKLHEGEILCVDVNSNGVVATGGTDGLKFASVITGKSILSLNEFEDCVESVKFSSNNSWLAAGSLDGSFVIWDVAAGRQRHRVQLGNESGICKLAWAGPDRVLVASLDGKTREYDARSGDLVRSWEGHTSNLLDLSVAGTIFATSSEDRTVKIFDRMLR